MGVKKTAAPPLSTQHLSYWQRLTSATSFEAATIAIAPPTTVDTGATNCLCHLHHLHHLHRLNRPDLLLTRHTSALGDSVFADNDVFPSRIQLSSRDSDHLSLVSISKRNSLT